MISEIQKAANTETVTLGDMLSLAELHALLSDIKPPTKDGMTSEEFRAEMRKFMKFSYAAGKNIDKAVRVKNAAEKCARKSPEFIEFDTAREALAKDHACLDEDGKPIISGNSYVIKDGAIFASELEELRERHAKAIEERGVQVEAYNAMLEEPIDVNLHTVKMEDLPESLTPMQIAVCSIFIKD